MSFKKQKNDRFSKRGNYKKASGPSNSGSYHSDGAAGGSSIGGGGYSGGLWSKEDKEAFVKEKRAKAAAIDKSFGYDLHESGPPRLGWLFNMVPTAMEVEEGVELAAVDLYFLEQDASTFKATHVYSPYLYVGLADTRFASECTSMLQRRFGEALPGVVVECVDKEDLELANHLAGHQNKFLRLKFNNVNDMVSAKRELQPIVEANKASRDKAGAYSSGGAGGGDATKKASSSAASSTSKRGGFHNKLGSGVGGGFLDSGEGDGKGGGVPEDFIELLIELREYDVAYSMRASIDLDLRCGTWYIVHAPAGGEAGRTDGRAAMADELGSSSEKQAAAQEQTASSSSSKAASSAVHPRSCSLEWQKDMMIKAEPKVLAFDIECTKEPLKFPQAERDAVFMISYMVDGQGFLIISREVVGEDVDNFEYTPKPGMEGPFHVFNELNEEQLLRRFFSHVQEVRPQIFVTYNGDFFDWPFLEKRAQVHGMSMSDEIGVNFSKTDDGYRGSCSVHLDCMAWVNRDSYLPQGSRSLKAVAKAKLGYDPVEVDPEDMVRFARTKPKHMATYSVSDAVATYYLYQKYIHDFIFALCTIIPLGPEDVLNKGSGTLCESLLMIEAFRENIICPNKQVDPLASFHQGHLLEAETYVGGHVEALETGVYRSDLEYAFNVDPATVQRLIDSVDSDLAFALEVENGVDRAEVTNYEAVKSAIVEQLEELRDDPVRTHEKPLIYHLDVAAMYPNIILTNRLQPSSMKSKADCAACEFNVEGSDCKRPMEWVWRGDYLPPTQSEYLMVKTQLMYENVEGRPFTELSEAEQALKVKQRLKGYSQKVYKKSKATVSERRTDTVCMREHPFYVNTVRDFRDRRYDFKKLTKTWKKNTDKAKKAGDDIGARQAADKEVLYDSLQLAHKCILNSFYGYVMRRGARWRSMEMAGIVTNTGAELIKQARELVENIGRPLELDTDGIWCILPASFPENFSFTTTSGSSVGISYPCVMLNAQVHDKFTNEQYQDLTDPVRRKYNTKAECSIFFEVDGPYRAMILPASTEEGKLLKKRYAVFNDDGSLAELKGFELKRRGELELIKGFQEQVFDQFLEGDSLQSCYRAVGDIANNWLDVIDTKGEEIDEVELIQLISENKTISGLVTDYGDQKITSLTTARRLGDYLGGEMLQDKGLNCRLVIANRPFGAPVTERAIPTVIFKAEPSVRDYWLRKWLKTTTSVEIRDVIDWSYYRERLGKTIQKIITIPAALQLVENPVPRVPHPDWLQRLVKERSSSAQTKITSMFTKLGKGEKYTHHSPTTSSSSSSSSSGGSGGKKVTPQGVGGVADMEDCASSLGGSGSKGSKNKAGGVQVSKVSRRRALVVGSESEEGGQQEEGAEHQEEEEAEAEVLVCPDRKKDFKGWLAFRKKGWRGLIARRKQEKKDAARSSSSGSGLQQQQQQQQWNNKSSSGSSGSGGGALVANFGLPPKKIALGLGDLAASSAKEVTSGVWQVLEVHGTEAPGEYVVWALTSARTLQRIALEVPKSLYLNSRVDPREGQLAELTKSFGARKVTRTLPRAAPSFHLYELSMPERRYLRNEKYIANVVSHADIQGVYETSTPGWFRCLLGLGCVAKVGDNRRHEEEQLRKRRERLTLRQRQEHAKKAAQAAAADQAGGLKGDTSLLDLKALSLGDMTSLSAGTHASYLSPEVATFKRVFLYHAHADTSVVTGAATATGTNATSAAAAAAASAAGDKSSRERSITAIFFVEGHNECIDPDLAAKGHPSVVDPTTGRAVYPSARVAVWISNPHLASSSRKGARADAEAAARPPFKRLVKDLLKQRPLIEDLELEVSCAFTKSPQASFDLASQALRDYHAEDKRRSGGVSTVVVCQTPFTQHALRKKVPALASEFAMVRMPFNRTDALFPPLQWTIACAEVMLKRYVEMPHWLRERLGAARYSQVPLGNLGDDPVSTAVDVSMARQLRHNKHVLWCSESGGGTPDLGGAEGDENDLWADEGGGGSEGASSSGRGMSGMGALEPVLSPGAYRCVCVELEVLNLCVDAIVCSGQLDALDGTSHGIGAMDVTTGSSASGNAFNNPNGSSNSGGGEEQGGYTGDAASSAFGSGSGGGGGGGGGGGSAQGDGAACASSFRILKAMVQGWLADVASAGSAQADELLLNLQRYLASRGALLHDPGLKRVVHQLTKKVFLRLVAELRRLGAEVVFADFGKLIICTGKHDVKAASEYVRFVVDTITAHPVFEYVTIQPTKYWEALLFLDDHNFGGLEASAVSLQNIHGGVKAAAGVSSSDLNNFEDAEAVAAAGEGVASPPSALKKKRREDKEDGEASNAEDEQQESGVSTEDREEISAAAAAADNDDEEEDDDIVVVRRRKKVAPSSSPSSLSLSPSSSGASSTARKINSQFNDDSDSDESGGETSHPRLALSPSSFKSKNKKNKRRQQWLGGGGGGGGSENEDEDEDEEGGGADGTRLGQEPEGDEFEGEEELEEDDDEDPTQPQVKWAWDLANYLPESVVEYFHIAVSKFLIKPWEKRRDLRQDRSRRLALLQQTHHLQLSQQQQGQHLLSPGAVGDTALASQVMFSPSALLSPGSPSPNKRHHDDLTPLTPGGGGGSSSSSSSSSQANAASVSGLSAKVDETDSETLERFVSVLVSKSLAHTLLQAVEEISEHCSKGGSEAVAKSFPLRAGSFRKDLANPSLEFVKCVCRVLSLDASVAEEVQRLRRTLLTQCGVREFAPESTFTDLGLCLVLPDVICECCNHHRDLDLCRDPSVTMEAVSERWRCQACESVYEKDAIELRLVDMIQRRSTRYQLQDLRCSKCLKVATRQLGLHCPCSGKLVCDEGPEAFAADLRVMKRVAIFHGFEWLREVVRNLSR